MHWNDWDWAIPQRTIYEYNKDARLRKEILSKLHPWNLSVSYNNTYWICPLCGLKLEHLPQLNWIKPQGFWLCKKLAKLSYTERLRKQERRVNDVMDLTIDCPHCEALVGEICKKDCSINGEKVKELEKALCNVSLGMENITLEINEGE